MMGVYAPHSLIAEVERALHFVQKSLQKPVSPRRAKAHIATPLEFSKFSQKK